MRGKARAVVTVTFAPGDDGKRLTATGKSFLVVWIDQFGTPHMAAEGVTPRLREAVTSVANEWLAYVEEDG